MKITVAICTWNGASRIGTTLESLTNLNSVGDLKWELLIVDNNSRDNTHDVCNQFSDRLPLRIVSESRQGHSFSRNCAIENARGEYIVWTDDDVKVDPNWITAYNSAIDDFPDASFWGGMIVPFFDFKIPKWISENWDVCGGVFAERNLGTKPLKIDSADQVPYGANFMTRRSLQEEFRFDSKFGRVASGVRGFDEIDVLSRMLDEGHTGVWVPDSIVHHLIPRSRTSLRYMADYFHGQGETWVQRGMSLQEPSGIKKKLRHHQIQYWMNRLRSSKLWFPHLVQSSNLRGQLNAKLSDK